MKKRGRIFVDIAIPVVLYSLIILVMQLVVGIVFMLVYYAAHTGVDPTAVAEGAEDLLIQKASLIALISNLLVVGVIVIDSRIRKVSLSSYTLLSKPIGGRGALMAVLAGLSFSMWVSLMLSLLPIPDSLMNRYNDASAFIGQNTFVDILSVCIVGPIVEELLFRGIVYKHLRICMSEYPAIILQAVIFAVLHGGSIVWVLYALVGGLLFGYIAMLSGSVRTTVIAHIMFNILGYLPLSDGVFSALAVASPVVLILSVRDIYKCSLKAE